MLIDNFRICVNIEFKYNIFRFGVKYNSNLFNIVIDHTASFFKGAGFTTLINGEIATLSLVDAGTVTLEIGKEKHYQLPISSRDEWDKFCETNFDGYQLDYYKSYKGCFKS